MNVMRPVVAYSFLSAPLIRPRSFCGVDGVVHSHERAAIGLVFPVLIAILGFLLVLYSRMFWFVLSHHDDFSARPATQKHSAMSSSSPN